MKPNQDPLDDRILDEILGECCYGKNFEGAKLEAKQRLLQWRSDYVEGLLPKKIERDTWPDDPREDSRARGYNQCIDDIRAKNERGL